MSEQRATTIPEYIGAAPAAGRPHLRRLYALLKRVAPHAQEAIKWGNPFFVEPRFLFAFSAHKAHLNFVTTRQDLEPFGEELQGFKTTKMGIVQIPYNAELPEALIQRMAEHRLRVVSQRSDDSFW